jgi:S-DNA-T family DNA segregation ATPase FtsK/SpoIIIE
MNGADKLLGRGDLMFRKPGSAKPIRAQASFVTDEEIERVVAHLKAQQKPLYNEELIARQDKPADAILDGDKDELYEMAKKLVLETRQASTSLLQRRLRLGYGRAARILDLMEQEGIVGPPQGSRPREVLVEGQQAMENRS